MTNHYDTIIIGAGLSGIAAGIRLSHYNKKVLILERHYLPGGLNSWYYHNKQYMDVGLHAVTNFASPKNRQAPINKLFRQLRFTQADFDICEQTYSSIDFPEVSLKFTNDISVLEQEVASKFPSQIDGFRKLLEKINTTDSLSLTAPYISTREIIVEFITDPLLIEMILEPVLYYGSAVENDIEFHQFCIMFQSIFTEGFWRPAAGMKPFINKLLQRYKENGGEIILNKGVKKLITKNDKISHIILDSGEELSADTILSSIGAEETLALCRDTENKIPFHPPGALSYVESIFILDKQPKELGVNSTISFFNKQNVFQYQSPNDLVDYRSGVICAPNNFNIAKDEQPTPAIRLTNLANYLKWSNLSPEEYQQAKQETINKQIELLCQQWPQIKDSIIDKDLFTPKTILRFTGHINGAIYGSPQKIRDGRMPYNNLFLCGTDQGFLGIVGSMLSGISIANQWILQG